jgi:pilus assembly protein CpaF
MSAVGTFGDVRRTLHERLLRRVDSLALDGISRTERRMRVREEALAVLREEGYILSQGALAKVVNEVSDAVVGMGPVEFLLKDPDVTEVMVNGPDDVYVERKGPPVPKTYTTLDSTREGVRLRPVVQAR